MMANRIFLVSAYVGECIDYLQVISLSVKVNIKHEKVIFG